MEALTPEQMHIVFVVYASAIVPLLAIPILLMRRLVPAWLLPVYIGAFIVTALGWEIWFTYGLIDGDNVDMRRALGLSQRIPLHLNWVLNSLADAGAICCGGLLVTWLVFGRDSGIFFKWHPKVLLFLLLLFLGQNIAVEMFLYQDQLAVGKMLSWAPLSPLGSFLNPTLFEFQGRTITLQGQMPWLIMTPLFYALLVKYLAGASRS
jgi:hypothetical protein